MKNQKLSGDFLQIAIITDVYPPDLSGVAQVYYYLNKYLRKNGDKVFLVIRERSKMHLAREEIPYMVSGSKQVFIIKSFPVFKQLFHSHKFDIILTSGTTGISTLFWLKRLRKHKTRIISCIPTTYLREATSIHTLSYKGEIFQFPPLKELFFKYINCPIHIVGDWLMAKFSDVVIACSKQTALDCEKDYKIKKNKLVVIPNGADNIHMDSKIQKSIAFKFSKPIVGYFGTFRSRKGIGVLLKAVEKLKKKYPNITLILAGDGVLTVQIKALTKKLKLSNNVKILNNIDNQSIGSYYKICDCVAMPSLYEGMPLVMLEAMAVESIVVASSVSGIPEIIKNGINGFLVPPNNPDLLADQLQMVIELSDKKRKKIKLNAYKTIRDKHSWDYITKKYIKLFSLIN